MTAPRYAIYYAPPQASTLDAFGRRWFGDSGPTLAGFSRERRNALTVRCRHHGFHATLKAPFRLSRQTSAAELRAELQAFAQQQAPVQVPPLWLGVLGGFLALVPREPAPAVAPLARTCVTAFDPFRAPPPHAKMAYRRAAGLSFRQMALLASRGYPHVREQFRFHLTLTGSIAGRAERTAVMQRILPLVTQFGRAPPLHTEEICLYRQETAEHAFVIGQRFRLGPTEGRIRRRMRAWRGLHGFPSAC